MKIKQVLDSRDDLQPGIIHKVLSSSYHIITLSISVSSLLFSPSPSLPLFSLPIEGLKAMVVMEKLGLTESAQLLSPDLLQNIYLERMTVVEQQCSIDIHELLLERVDLFHEYTPGAKELIEKLQVRERERERERKRERERRTCHKCMCLYPFMVGVIQVVIILCGF